MNIEAHDLAVISTDLQGDSLITVGESGDAKMLDLSTGREIGGTGIHANVYAVH